MLKKSDGSMYCSLCVSDNCLLRWFEVLWEVECQRLHYVQLFHRFHARGCNIKGGSLGSSATWMPQWSQTITFYYQSLELIAGNGERRNAGTWFTEMEKERVVMSIFTPFLGPREY